MKKYLAVFLLVVYGAFVHAEMFQKDFVVGGETVVAWAELEGVTEYDEAGREVYAKDTDMECWRKYDEGGREIYAKFLLPNGEQYETLTEYSGGQKTHEKMLLAFGGEPYERWYEYDAKGNIVSVKDSDSKEEKRKYDKNGRLVYLKDKYGYVERLDYDKKGNLVHTKADYGYEEWFAYDESGNLTHYRYAGHYTGGEERFEYDESGRRVSARHSDGTRKIYEYEFWDNGNVRKKTAYRVTQETK